ncbi:LacI family DNA-binding transcriptional regulator [Paenibacillus sp. NFR01]|uniref:LacI family DNA-binding transcriptional regulator n=1 Tax=Paenibacillus sp. NFR01 TaxID=1566279 RepID=UPI0008CCDA37|nr:LacI family DNA-binding transcriptional regulator [Paenibacillus sp. NFR01]SET89255.1 transcriptional regulator, LacI family [Paenibacillus sp. NFR01]
MSKFEKIMELSGYSRATVSRVINRSPHVSAAARAKILAIMAELDYVPNRNAVSLSTGQTRQIGMVCSVIEEIMRDFMNGFVEVALEGGYQTIIYTSRGDRATELQAFEDLRSKRVDALVIVTCVNDPAVLQGYCEYGPIVSWQRMAEGGIPSVAMDQGGGYRLALEHLLARGHTRIANIFGRKDSLNTHSRREAYEDMMSRRGLPMRREWYRYTLQAISDGERALDELGFGGQAAGSGLMRASTADNLREETAQVSVEEAAEGKRVGHALNAELARAGEERETANDMSCANRSGQAQAARESGTLPSAVLCANDSIAAGIVAAARRRGIAVPGELAVVGFDNTELAAALGITTVDNPIGPQARAAFAELAAQLAGREPVREALAYRLVVRETT